MMYRAMIALATIVGCLSLVASTPDVDVLTLARATSRFSLQLYKELALNPTVAFYSPFSAHTALSIAYLGARGTTAEQIKTVLQLSSLPEPHDAYSKLLTDLNSTQRVTLLTANGLWANPTLPVLQEYKDSVASKYFAQVGVLEFSKAGGPEGPINSYIAQQTQGKITDVLGVRDVKPGTSTVLVNALFFSGAWKSPFDVRDTKTGAFQKNERIDLQVDFMTQVGTFDLKLSAVENVDVVRLPFLDERFALYIALPNAPSDLAAFETQITGESFDINVLFTGLTSTRVNLTLPKWNITSTLKLNNALIDLGMPEIFTQAADFSGISGLPISFMQILQKVAIEVSETGTVASAADVVVLAGSRQSFEEPPVDFKADHPYVYFLRDDLTGLILFQGKQADPTISHFTAGELS
ncbi:unnamed protein product [Lymnaea stagnalis]|uniref:Serpin domain-containing protein n=1 Tax=Lymnaea stagnalis TaxID=6523 RepID=A0AAV2HWX3_LYMST